MDDLAAIARQAVENGAGQLEGELAWMLGKFRQVYTGAGILEVGCDAGGTLSAFVMAGFDPVFGVTLPNNAGPFTSGRERRNNGAKVIEGDSHDPATIARVLELHPEPFDAIFIDADHRYQGVDGDFRIYRKLVREGGLLGFHDVTGGEPELVGQVWQWWIERKQEGWVTEERCDRASLFGVGLIHL